jgi:hypothetical protein
MNIKRILENDKKNDRVWYEQSIRLDGTRLDSTTITRRIGSRFTHSFTKLPQQSLTLDPSLQASDCSYVCCRVWLTNSDMPAGMDIPEFWNLLREKAGV